LVSAQQAERIAEDPGFVHDSPNKTTEESLVQVSLTPTLAAADASKRIQNRMAWLVYFGDGSVTVPVAGPGNDGGPTGPIPSSYKADWWAYVDSSTGEMFRAGSA
jgi:hypothetical protein